MLYYNGIGRNTRRKTGRGSLLTHVEVVPRDGIRRTGKARVRIRLAREVWENRNAKKDRAPE